MTHYYGNQSSRSDLSDGEILRKTAKISPSQPLIADRNNQSDRHLNAIPHIVWHANADGAVTYLNSAWEQYTGVATIAALGFGYLASIHPEDRDRCRWLYRQTASLESSYEVELRLMTRSGIYRWNLARLSPANASEEALEWVGTYTDIDALKQTQGWLEAERESLNRLLRSNASETAENLGATNIAKKQEQLLELQNQLLLCQQAELENQRLRLQQQNLQLLEAAKLKSQFLRTMSHELRTPMNAIIGFSQLLLRQEKQMLTAQQKDFVGRIFKNGKNLLVLINDILDISKIEAYPTELEIAEFDLAELVIATALELGNQVIDKNLVLSVSVCLQDGLIVNDKSRLRQVLVNLISNAIKFTHQGNICISVRELTSDRLTIAVTDTGIGITETELPQIFDKFHQADRATTRQYPGIGLGLAISASLVRIMEGTLAAESQVGKGSTFRLELPRQIK